MDISIKKLTTPLPVFVGGSNCGTKLDVTARAGLNIIYRPANRIFIVTYKGDFVCIDQTQCNFSPTYLKDLNLESKVQSDVESAPRQEPIVPVKHHPMKKGIESAQVGDPTRGNMG